MKACLIFLVLVFVVLPVTLTLYHLLSQGQASTLLLVLCVLATMSTLMFDTISLGVVVSIAVGYCAIILSLLQVMSQEAGTGSG